MPRIGLELDSFVLIAAKQDDFFAAGFDEEADVAFPAQKAFARKIAMQPRIGMSMGSPHVSHDFASAEPVPENPAPARHQFTNEEHQEILSS